MQPHKMMRIMNYSINDTETIKTAQLCCQCNMCELFACPAGIHPKMANLYRQDVLAEQKVKYKPEKTEYRQIGERISTGASKETDRQTGIERF